MMASGKSAKRSRSAAPVVSRRQGLPWLTIGAVVVVLILIGGIFVVVYSKNKSNEDAAAAVAPFVPSATDMDPSTKITGIYAGKSTVAASGSSLSFTEYKAALHVSATQRVAYDRYPPVGGPHDAEWADCNGDIYPTAVRNENMVHPLEHGAIWITYNPTTIAAGDLDKLKALVTGKTYIYMSPYPNLDSPISLQAWAHQLKVTSASDIRIKQFITALQQNTYVAPEPGGSCDQPGFFAAPPAFDASQPGADAIQMNGAGLTADTTEGIVNAGTPAASGAAASGSAGAVPSGAATTSVPAAPVPASSVPAGTTSVAPTSSK